MPRNEPITERLGRSPKLSLPVEPVCDRNKETRAMSPARAGISRAESTQLMSHDSTRTKSRKGDLPNASSKESVYDFLARIKDTDPVRLTDAIKHRLQVADGHDAGNPNAKFVCPCGKNNLTFSPVKPEATCWGGCDSSDTVEVAKRLNAVDDIAAELGYQWGKPSTRKAAATSKTPSTRGKGFTSLEDAERSAKRGYDRAIVYKYGESHAILRLESDSKPKSFRSVHKADGKWHLADGSNPWPVYMPRKPVEGDVIVICEGEKAADAINRTQGIFVGATSHGGSGRSGGTDWSSLPVGYETLIFPDNDDSGAKYAHAVAGLINRPCQIIDVSSLPPTGDAADLLEGLEGPKADTKLREFITANARPYEPPVDVVEESDEVHPALQCADTDGGRGRILADLLHKKALHVHEWKGSGWLWWSGQRWERASAKVQQAAKKLLPAEIAKRFSDYRAAKAADDYRAISHALAWISTDPRISTDVSGIDSNNWLFNCANVTLDLETGKPRDADPADRITKISPTYYDQSATCPKFMETLEYFVHDPEVRKMLQMHAGSALTGIVTHLKLPILHGQGNNGKSTIITAIADTMGPDYAAVLDAEIITSTGQNGRSDATYHIADLHGKRLVVVNELEESATLKTSALKKLISSDAIQARRPHEMPFNFKPTFKAFMLTNHKPKLKTTDNGTMRRLALVPFDVTIDPAKDVKNFNMQLRAESPGILNWMIKGLEMWKAAGMDIKIPPVVAAATDAYANDEDQIGQFFAACVVKKSGGFVPGKKLYDTYRLWCEASGYEPATLTAFGRRAQMRYRAKRSMTGTMYENIIIQHNAEDQ